MRSKFLLVVLAAAIAGLSLVGSAGALNPQPFPPRVLGIVRDACTGLPIAGATVGIGSPGAVNPGPINTGAFGEFSIDAVAPGSYSFSVSAPGYEPVGINPGPQQTPGAINPGPIQVTRDPGPVQVSESIVASVLLAPATPGARCTVNPGPTQVPALIIVVRSARTGLPVLRAQATLTPASGERDPGPQQFGLLGTSVWSTLGDGSYGVTVASPGYVPVGDPASGDPGPIQLTKDPGPMQFPDGGSVAFGKTLDVLLTPAH